jgi:hypothetical protein
MQVGVLFAFWRLVHLGLTTILALSRLNQCIFTVGSKIDRGYSCFLAMALMVHVLDLKAAEEQEAQLTQGGMELPPAEAVPPLSANAALPGAKSEAVEAAASVVVAPVITSPAANRLAGSRRVPAVAPPGSDTSLAEWERHSPVRGGMSLSQTHDSVDRLSQHDSLSTPPLLLGPGMVPTAAQPADSARTAS